MLIELGHHDPRSEACEEVVKLRSDDHLELLERSASDEGAGIALERYESLDCLIKWKVALFVHLEEEFTGRHSDLHVLVLNERNQLFEIRLDGLAFFRHLSRPCHLRDCL